MSYLNSPGITFSGDFQSDVSTVNNDVRHYDIKTFEKRFQAAPETIDGPDGQSLSIENGWWNPDGGATFNLVNCKIRQTTSSPGSTASAEELIGFELSGAKDRAPGKMVDLDPQMQMTSELWAVKIRISAPDGSLLLEGDLHPTGFRDLGTRQFPKNNQDTAYVRNGQSLGAHYVSIIENITWAEKATQIPLITELKKETQDNKLSIGFSVSAYYYAHQDGRFSLGKVIGSIGPWKKTEPLRFAATRRLWTTDQSYFTDTNFLVQPGRIRVDLGMSFPMADPLGSPYPAFKELFLAVCTGTPISSSDTTQNLDPATYELLSTLNVPSDPQWLLNTGGIWDISITPAQQLLIKERQVLLLARFGKNTILLCREAAEGWYIRCDQNVIRLDPGETISADFYTYQWGKPAAGQTITIMSNKPGSGGGGGSTENPKPPLAKIPWINQPVSALKYVATSVTDLNGKATVQFKGSDPGNPRGYLDGQIYILNYGIKGLSTDQHGLDQVFVHLRDEYVIPKNPVWSDIKDTMIQYANLYPIMSKHVADLGDPHAVIKKKEIILFAFTRAINDPIYMPVTRDLSANKLATIVKWLNNPILDDKKTEKISLKSAALSFEAFQPLSQEDLPILAEPKQAITVFNLKSSEPS
ncbi:hypothetical protein SAMN05421820_103113 [Pedobacter steynii]|uniref:Uncharacterized protein n=1 Tax=Pedobacter steynii TaxID=430522 RepID=A0A1G9R490_9SPHI|nr:hypothetical protein [Pedobacter steynii]NQX37886.1 hypothetical protein [Pedobacter steynii]SDM17940.1 hypothetical protein SAMN05421820_103113 [Pedobacter steynii]